MNTGLTLVCGAGIVLSLGIFLKSKNIKVIVSCLTILTLCLLMAIHCIGNYASENGDSIFEFKLGSNEIILISDLK